MKIHKMENIMWDHSLDAVLAAPDHHKVLLENDEVRVLETRVAPGEKTPVHTHRWPGALYVLSWSDFKRYDHNGNLIFDSRTAASRPATGTTIWSGPMTAHFIENIGNEELRVIAVELKNARNR